MLKQVFAILGFLLLALPALGQVPGTSIQINRTPITQGTTGLCLYDNAGKVGEQACGTGTAADIKVGTTTISSGTTTRILYDNAGVLGEYTLSGSGTVVPMQTGASLITPDVGVATGTSLALGGATIGTDALSVTGTTTLTGAVVTTSTLNLGNTSSFGWTGRGQLSSSGAGKIAITASSNIAFLQLGGTTSASPSIKKNNSTTLQVRLADDSADAPISASTATLSALASDAATTNNTVCATTTTGILTKGSGANGICLGTSSARFKHDIFEERRGVDRLAGLRPVSYKYNGGDERPLYGFIAEEVAVAMPELVSLSADGLPNSVDIIGIIPFLVNSIKELKAEITELKSR